MRRRSINLLTGLLKLENRVNPVFDDWFWGDHFFFDNFDNDDFDFPLEQPNLPQALQDVPDPDLHLSFPQWDWSIEDTLPVDPSTWFPIGSDRGSAPVAALLNGSGQTLFSVQPYGKDFLGGVRVAAGDVDGDGTTDLIAAPGPGMASLIRVYSGRDASLIREFLAFEESFQGGVYVVAADMNRDGSADIILSPDEGGGPRVRILNGKTLGTLQDFYGIDDLNFRGGARVAVGDLNSDYIPDLTVSAGFGGGPRIAVFNGLTLFGPQQGITRLVPDFYAFEDTLRNGAYPAVGDLNGDGFADLIFGGGPGGGPRVLCFDGNDLLGGSFNPLANFYAGDPEWRDGVQVGFATSPTGQGSIFASPLSQPLAQLFAPSGQLLQSLNPISQINSAYQIGSAPFSALTNSSYTNFNNTSSGLQSSNLPTTGSSVANAAFNHGVVTGNFRGNYTGEYWTPIFDEKAPSGQNTKRVRVEVQLRITSVTPWDANADPGANNGGNYSYRGVLTIRPAGYRSMEVAVHGNYTCTQFPTPFKRQQGSMSLFTDSYASNRLSAGITGTDWNNGQFSTNIFDFRNPGVYYSTSPNGTLTMRKVSN